MNVNETIRNLLNLANHPNTGEGEASAALSRAAALAAKYSIDLEKLEGKKEPKIVRGEMLDTVAYFRYLYSAVGVLYPVECVVYRTGKVQFVGNPVYIDAATFTYTWLQGQIELFYKRSLPKGLTKGERAEFRRTFKHSCAARVMVRARELMQKLHSNDAEARRATGHNALVVAGHFDSEKKAVAEYLDNQNVSKRKTSGKSPKMGSGSLAGWQSGENVKLRQEASDC